MFKGPWCLVLTLFLVWGQVTVKIYPFPSQEPEPKVLASNVQGKFCLHCRASARTVNPSEMASALALNSVLSTVNSAGTKVSLRGSNRLSGAHLNTLSLFHCKLHDCHPQENCALLTSCFSLLK